MSKLKNISQILLITLLIVASAAAAAYYYCLKGYTDFSDAAQIASLKKEASEALDAGRFAEAGDILDRAMKSKVDKEMLHERAVVYLKLEQPEDALKILNGLVKDSPDKSILLDRASALYMNKSYDAALRDYERIVADKDNTSASSPKSASSPDSASSKSSYREGALLGRVLCQCALAHYPLAVHECRRILEQNPQNVKVMECLANSYLGMGDNQGAIQAYTGCLRLEQNADFYWGRCLAYIRDRRPAEGLADLKKAAAMAPKNKKYKAKLDELTAANPK